MESEQRMLDRTRIAEQIRPDIAELLSIEIQIKKLKLSIAEKLKGLNLRKKEVSKRVELCMTENKFSKIRGDQGIITLVTRAVPVKMDAVILAEKLSELLDDEAHAVRLAAQVFEEQETQEKRSVLVRPESLSNASEEELNVNANS